MSVVSKIMSGASLVRSAGPTQALRYAAFRLYEGLEERRLNIETTGLHTPQELGLASPESISYSPVPYRALRWGLDRAGIRPGADALLDYGCGKGRAVVVAATRPLRRVVGIDMSPRMIETVRENLRRASGALKCPVSLELADAANYEVPDDITIVHMFNPFVGETLRSVVANVRASLARHPRELKVIFANPSHFESMFAAEGWLERLDQRTFYPRTGCAVYACHAAPAGSPRV